MTRRTAKLTSSLPVVVGIVAATVLLVRHRRRPKYVFPPLTGVVVLRLVLQAGVSGFVLLFELVLAGNFYGSRWVRGAVVAVALAVAAALVVQGATSGVPTGRIFLASVQNLLPVGLAVSSGLSLRLARDSSDRERARAEAIAAASRAEKELVDTSHRLEMERTRARVARDMHDVVAGRLSAIWLQSSMLRVEAAEGSRTAELIDDILVCSDDALKQVQGMIALLGESDSDLNVATDQRERLGRLVRSAHIIGADIDLQDEIPDDAVGPAADAI